MTEELNNLRSEIRTWLAENTPKNWRDNCHEQDVFVDLQKSWFQKLVAGGYAIPHWPKEWPGGGRSLAAQKVIYEELARADAPRLLLTFVSTYHAASTLFEWASEEQQQYYLPRILEGEIWCQGFSEPGAGSDLANVKCKAELKGDKYIINGQKIWSTMGQFADRCLLLARTDGSGAKQAGLVFLMLDMKAKGVTVRPIHQIHGDEEFAEVFFDDVEVPVSERLGEDGQGWQVAQATLASERGLTLLELSEKMRGSLGLIADSIREAGREEDAGTMRDFGRLIAEVNAACALADAYLNKRIDGTEQVGDASFIKLKYARTLRLFADFGVKLQGFDAQYRAPITIGDLQTGNWMADFMNSYAWTIAGGSDEVQRNIISERVLGMPREPKSWKLAEMESKAAGAGA